MIDLRKMGNWEEHQEQFCQNIEPVLASSLLGAGVDDFFYSEFLQHHF